jgi:hypothetical protein
MALSVLGVRRRVMAGPLLEGREEFDGVANEEVGLHFCEGA